MEKMKQMNNQKGQNHRHCNRECLTEPVRLNTLFNLTLTMHPDNVINITTKACVVVGLTTWAALDKAEVDDRNWMIRVNEDTKMCVRGKGRGT